MSIKNILSAFGVNFISLFHLPMGTHQLWTMPFFMGVWCAVMYVVCLPKAVLVIGFRFSEGLDSIPVELSDDKVHAARRYRLF